MPRQPRIDYPGAFHHVTNRGQNHQTTFRNDSDFELFLLHLGYAVREFKIQVLSFVLMTTHYHLLIRSLEGALSEAMQLIGGRYTQDFNRRYSLDGSLFKGRFFSKIIENEAYLLEAARYVPNNPVKAGMVQRAQDHKWSSYPATLGLTPAPDFLSPLVIVDEHFNGNVSAFDAFVRQRGTTKKTEIFAHIAEADRPEQHLAQSIGAVEHAAERLNTCAVRDASMLSFRAAIFEFVCSELNLSMLELASPRSPREHNGRLLLLTLLHQHQLSTSSDLAVAFGFGYGSGVVRAIRRFEAIAAAEPELRATLHAGSKLFVAAA